MARIDVSASCELLVPKARFERIAAIVGTAIIVTFLVLAAKNLFQETAVVPSLIWILLVVFVVISNVRQSGLSSFAAGVLGAFSRKQVLIVSTAEEGRVLEVGSKFLSWNVIEHRVPASDLVTIRCSAGQASDLAGRDVNDWSVVLWY